MKRTIRTTGWGLGLLALACLPQGCTQSVPGLGAVLAPPLPNTVVSYFNYASTKVNPSLLGQLKGFFQDGTYGYTTDSGIQLEAPLFSAGLPDPSGSPYALHLSGTYTDYGNAAYPAFELDCYPVANASYASGRMYDVSSFTGIKFSWNYPSDDNSQQRFF
ncbi:MAG TPA: hypothetical protein VFR02_04860, partial [bacterium]|nr:hypothetical protein [bacterium]